MPLYLDGFLIPLASFLAFAYVADVQHSVLLRLLQAMAQVEAHQVRLSQLEQLRTEEALQERVRELERSVLAAQARQEEERAAAEAHVRGEVGMSGCRTLLVHCSFLSALE